MCANQEEAGQILTEAGFPQETVSRVQAAMEAVPDTPTPPGQLMGDVGASPRLEEERRAAYNALIKGTHAEWHTWCQAPRNSTLFCERCSLTWTRAPL